MKAAAVAAALLLGCAPSFDGYNFGLVDAGVDASSSSDAGDDAATADAAVSVDAGVDASSSSDAGDDAATADAAVSVDAGVDASSSSDAGDDAATDAAEPAADCGVLDRTCHGCVYPTVWCVFTRKCGLQC